jgi:uncharacterized membrane protein YeaQ/YmgE (transglycosylase-associated protein family)
MVMVTTAFSAAPSFSSNQRLNGGSRATILAWIVVGLVSGYLASRVINKTGEGTLRDIILGIIEESGGGILFRAIGGQGVTRLNLGSILVAFIGAVVVLILYHAAAGRGRVA